MRSPPASSPTQSAGPISRTAASRDFGLVFVLELIERHCQHIDLDSRVGGFPSGRICLLRVSASTPVQPCQSVSVPESCAAAGPRPVTTTVMTSSRASRSDVAIVRASLQPP